jgi:dockerin type I repeat protein
MNTPKWIIVIVLVLALSMPVTPVSAQARSASIGLTSPLPIPGLIGGDVNFNLTIDVANIDPGVAGAEIYVSYDPGVVEPPASPIGVAEALPDFFGVSNIGINELLPKEECPPPTGGPLPCVHLVVAGPAQITHSGAAVRFHFRGKAPGRACFAVLKSVLADADGFDVPHMIAPPNPQCVDIVPRATVKGKVLRQGTPANPPGPGTLACSEVMILSGGTVVSSAFTDVFGNFTLPPLPLGTYTVRATYSGYLASAIMITVSYPGPLVIDLGPTTLRGGDVNDVSDVTGDGKINILDIGEVISEFTTIGAAVGSSTPGACGGPEDSADINDDGNVNIYDLAIGAGNWGCTSPTLWMLSPPTRCIP